MLALKIPNSHQVFRILLLLGVGWLVSIPSSAQRDVGSMDVVDADVYRVTTLRAAPGDLLLLIDSLIEKAELVIRGGQDRPLIIRHSQGDSWDLMVIQKVTVDHTLNQLTSRSVVPATYNDLLTPLISVQEDLLVKGPPYQEFRLATEAFSYFHVEMFVSLAGKEDELLKEREMENEYLELLERPQNFIFTRLMGSKFDIFTLGCYRDLSHYAESGQIPSAREETAAIAAGFDGVGTIGSYLRSLILEHHDTLATKVY